MSQALSLRELEAARVKVKASIGTSSSLQELVVAATGAEEYCEAASAWLALRDVDPPRGATIDPTAILKECWMRRADVRGPNLVRNGDFALGTQYWGRSPEADADVLAERNAQTGKPMVHINFRGGNWAVLVQSVTLEPNTAYGYTMRVMSQGPIVSLYWQADQGHSFEQNRTYSAWTELVSVFVTPSWSGPTVVHLSPVLVMAPGRVWVEDVHLGRFSLAPTVVPLSSAVRVTANHTPSHSSRRYLLPLLELAFWVVLLVLLLAPQLSAALGHLPLSLALAHAAGRNPKAGPLFLGIAPAAAGGGDSVCDRQSDGDPHATYLRVLLCQAEGRGHDDIERRRSVAMAGFRRPFSQALLAFALQTHGQQAQARRVWQACPSGSCETLLVRAGTIDACRAAAALGDGGRRAAFCMGALVRNRGPLDEALHWYERALASQPHDDSAGQSTDLPPSAAEILYRMGEIEIARGNLPQAWTFTNKCLAEQPDHYWGLFQHAMLVAREGKTNEAIAELERTLQRYPVHGAALFNLGLLYQSAGNPAEAERCFVDALKIASVRAWAEAELERLKRK